MKLGAKQEATPTLRSYLCRRFRPLRPVPSYRAINDTNTTNIQISEEELKTSTRKIGYSLKIL
jgi:hypothetical protein